ncbi:MAG: GIY-YIG nuclease family protein [Candidatus Pacebacteria bacterium]|nr:GIY-YIG nuclease family protein [Candidatus Paceibacterota bacterium]
MENIKEKIKTLPSLPGVYIFKDIHEQILYIGKAKNIKKRVSSHFAKPKEFGFDFISLISDIETFECQNEKEALLLESELIKKLQPKYNIEWKDDKNYFFVGITKEIFPRIFITHQKDNINTFIGPFVKGTELKSFLKNLRKILPYRSCRNLPKKPCLYYQLEMCSAPCINSRKKKQYQRIIQIIKALLMLYNSQDLRLECYDISNLSGTLATGSMTVFEKNKKKTKDYRMFKIKRIKGQNDVGSLKEIILRRLKHKDWKNPDLMLLDGGKGQLKAAKKIEIPVLALAKSKKRSGKIFSLFSKNFIYADQLPENIKNIFLQIRDEAHRFAISYHKKRRIKNLDIK